MIHIGLRFANAKCQLLRGLDFVEGQLHLLAADLEKLRDLSYHRPLGHSKKDDGTGGQLGRFQCLAVLIRWPAVNGRTC
jgi:hypothetical protein